MVFYTLCLSHLLPYVFRFEFSFWVQKITKKTCSNTLFSFVICRKSGHGTCVHECGAPNPVPPPPAESGPSPNPMFAPDMNTKRLMKTKACTECNKFGAQQALLAAPG